MRKPQNLKEYSPRFDSIKSTRKIFFKFVCPSHITLTLRISRILKEKSIYDVQKHKYSCQIFFFIDNSIANISFYALQERI